MARRKVNLSDQLQAQTTNIIRIVTDKQLEPAVKIALLKTHQHLSNKQFDTWIRKLEEDIEE